MERDDGDAVHAVADALDRRRVERDAGQFVNERRDEAGLLVHEAVEFAREET